MLCRIEWMYRSLKELFLKRGKNKKVEEVEAAIMNEVITAAATVGGLQGCRPLPAPEMLSSQSKL